MEERDSKVETPAGAVRSRLIVPPNAAAGAPVLVFMHEGLGSIGQWRDFPAALARETGLAAVVFDRPGFGGSDPLLKPRDPKYLQREDLDSLCAVLEYYQIATPILVGHSDGGTLSLLYAAAFPDRPLGVIVEAAHVFVEETTLTGIRAAVSSFDAGALKVGLSRYHGDKTEAMFRRWADEWLSPEFASWNIQRRLSGILCPVLVIQGEDDQYGTLAQVEAIRSGVSGPAETFLVPKCGHSPHLEAREVVLERMTRFIRKVLQT